MTHCERLLALLSDGRPHTFSELYGLHIIAHSRVADLRKKGHTILCKRDPKHGYIYQLLPSQPSPLTPPPVSSFAGGGVSGILGGSSSGREEPPEPIPGQLSLDAA